MQDGCECVGRVNELTADLFGLLDPLRSKRAQARLRVRRIQPPLILNGARSSGERPETEGRAIPEELRTVRGTLT